MEPSVKEMSEFLQKLAASGINSIQEMMDESKHQISNLLSELSNIQGAIAAKWEWE